MKIRLIAFGAALAAAVAVLAGCASTGYEKAAATSTALQQTALEMGQGSAQLTETMAYLNNLIERPEGDMRPQFEKFSSAFDKLQSLAQDVDSKATDMQAKGQDYFQDWDQQLASIKNEDLRARSAKRQKQVSDQFVTLNGDYQEAKTAFTPLMSNLHDIRTALSDDLTSSGIDSVKQAVAQANKQVPSLQKAIKKLSADFKALGVSLSATAPAPQ